MKAKSIDNIKLKSNHKAKRSTMQTKMMILQTAVSVKVTQAYALKTKTSALATNKELTLLKQQLKTKNIKVRQGKYVKN